MVVTIGSGAIMVMISIKLSLTISSQPSSSNHYYYYYYYYYYQARNSLEAYLYEVKNKFMDHEEEVNAVSTEDQRTVVSL